MRWKAIFFEGHPDQEQARKTFGWKPHNCPPSVKDLAEFEKELFDVVNKVEFRCVNCSFQSRLREDIEKVKTSDKVTALTFCKESSLIATFVNYV